MSNLNLSGFSDPLYGNQYYRSISAHGTKSAFEPGSIDASKLDKCKTLEQCLSVNIDLSKHYDNASDCVNSYNRCCPVNGAGAVNSYIKLTPLPVLDPQSLITVVTYDGNNSIEDKDFRVEVGVLYGPDSGPDPVVIPSMPSAFVQYVTLGNFDPVDAGATQVLGAIPTTGTMNSGVVQIYADGDSILPDEYKGGQLGTPVLKIMAAQNPAMYAGNVKVKVKWISP